STNTISFETLPCANPRASGTISDTLTESSISDGILNGERVAVAMRSIDDFDNVGLPGDVEAVFPTSVDDFFELYDGGEDGGFCFIATAAYGSYAHPLVRVLRAFRDRVLKRTAIGEAFVWAYYRYAPPVANKVAADPALAGWIRLWLVPVAALAILIMLCPLFAMLWLGRLAWRSRAVRASRAARTAALLLVGAAVLLSFSSVAHATRPKADLPVGIGLEFKGGPYSGAIQDETGFGEVFDSESRPLFTLGVDVQVFRAFGTATVGGSIGFLQYTGKGLFGKGSPTPGTPSSDTNVFSLLPMTLQIGYRFDVLADNTWIPLVPYVRGGFAYYIWWATNGVGDL
ncbi:MAG: CFI-box-CTERM domain-containing protein, partial [Myxococcota bacterium]